MAAVITHLLLDIEGTTCPVSFVAEVLFPYARQRLGSYLQEHGDDPAIQGLIQAVDQAWAADDTREAVDLRRQLQADEARLDANAVVPYLEWLIDHDIKLTALKDLQGRIWQAGYASGDLIAPLYADVPDALNRWHSQGLVLAVYSSGSVPAQQLLYGHSQAGDLRALFQHWFDTRSGLKQQAQSYHRIAESMGASPQHVLFVSDSLAELEAADTAGMAVLFSDRDGNPAHDPGRFERITNYSHLSLDNGILGT
ncbi:acireductone synthase [Vulcanococcus limneticus Candia 3F8]|uniref:acireductone synthase n=1 Tax=Vulcanococcus limneticus TaxID=2170428 RepID=UPI000B98732E|nr:acireductone synthase [Vulcanococcus limneticus]MCP9793446.1 acireductone synthase [Vulcanococcus limneticus MW73D5]MCP9895438.1 acireductone synthase [Vulcanococcus limneticus Candia 3F8]MCP9898807.1 acireductone synthase [Vulcanococcus limneticus Candia 3B3]